MMPEHANEAPNPELMYVQGKIEATQALVSLKIRYDRLRVYAALVKDPEAFKPFADRVLELTEQNMKIVRRTLGGKFTDEDRNLLLEKGMETQKAIYEMVKFQSDNDCWLPREEGEE